MLEVGEEGLSATTYHCCVDLSALAKGRDFALLALRAFDASVRESPTEYIIAQAVIKQAQGMTAWPLCDNPTKEGHCAGHKE